MAHDPPPQFPPPPPREPFLRLRTPREGTLLGLQVPPPPTAPAALGGAPAPASAELERKLDDLTRELGSFRELIVRAARAAAPPPATAVALPARRSPGPRSAPGARRRELQHRAAVGLAGAVLALSVAFASAAAALAVPDYARLVARAARLGAPPAAGLRR